VWGTGKCGPGEDAFFYLPKFLADALAIGPTLRLIDGLSPGMTSDPSGTFCVIMPCRCVAEAEDAPEAGVERAAAKKITMTTVPAIAA
jgi:hypothetical protein